MLGTCQTCNARVAVRTHGEYVFGHPREGPPVKAILASCPECKEPMLLGVEYYGSDSWSDPWRMYPADKTRLSHAVPRDLRAAYREAITSFSAQAYTASAVMCRKVLEAASVQFGIEERTLAQSLERLREEGLIDTQLHEWASELRAMGNEAAHGVGLQIDRQDAEDTIAFTEAIIDYLFVYRQRFREFTERRAERDAAGDG